MAAGTALTAQDKECLRRAVNNPTTAANLVSWIEAIDTLTGVEMSVIDGVTPGTAAAGKALVLDSSGIIDLVTATAIAAPLVAGHGDGFVSTAFAPITSRRIENGTIITEIKFDMDGLAVQGDTAKDVIGLSAAASSYIGRYVVATFGIVYRIEMICTVLPTEETSTIAKDLDLAKDSVNRAQNATAATVLIDAGTVVAGQMYSTDTPDALANNDYLYLVEGAGTDGTTGEYSGGQFIIRFYGHAVMT